MLKKSFPLCVAMCLLASFIPATAIQQEIAVQPGKTLEIDLKTGGDIQIEGWEKSAVSVDGRLTGSDRDNYDVSFQKTESGVELRTRYTGSKDNYDSSGNFVIRVPNRFNLNIDSMGGGITIRNLEGTFDGSTMGGPLRLSGLKGDISLSTMGGNVDLTNSHLDGEVSTMGGTVLIEGVTGNVQGSSMGGAVTQKRAASGKGGATGEVSVSSMGGALRIEEAPEGAELMTMGGNIDIGSARDHVSAKTMGGDIQIDAIDGWVHAETMGGNVNVTMVGDPSKGKRDVDLRSYSGDIELTVPENLAMSLELEIAYTKGHNRHTIYSDFPLRLEESDEWNYHDGSPRKYIHGSGKIGNGTHRVRISTINGDITIRKH